VNKAQRTRFKAILKEIREMEEMPDAEREREHLKKTEEFYQSVLFFMGKFHRFIEKLGRPCPYGESDVENALQDLGNAKADIDRLDYLVQGFYKGAVED